MTNQQISNQVTAVIEAFGALSIPEQQQFFIAVSKCLDFPTVVRDIASEAADELGTYLDFHGVQAIPA